MRGRRVYVCVSMCVGGVLGGHIVFSENHCGVSLSQHWHGSFNCVHYILSHEDFFPDTCMIMSFGEL